MTTPTPDIAQNHASAQPAPGRESDDPGQADAADLAQGLKAAMRAVAASVSIITTRENGLPHGMTATAVSSLTLDPPSLVICINKNASIHDPLLRSERFCVNFLQADHRGLCADFSGKKIGQDRFSDGSWMLSDSEPPHLIDAQASIFCKVDERLAYGTHTLVIGRVTRVETRTGIRALLYQNAVYGEFAPANS